MNECQAIPFFCVRQRVTASVLREPYPLRCRLRIPERIRLAQSGHWNNARDRGNAKRFRGDAYRREHL